MAPGYAYAQQFKSRTSYAELDSSELLN